MNQRQSGIASEMQFNRIIKKINETNDGTVT